jgi:DNA-binding transcriptional regulator YiaG
MTPADLKSWRTSRGLSQSEAARLLENLSVRTWQKWESPEGRPPVYLKMALMEADRRIARKEKANVTS